MTSAAAPQSRRRPRLHACVAAVPRPRRGASGKRGGGASTLGREARFTPGTSRARPLARAPGLAARTTQLATRAAGPAVARPAPATAALAPGADARALSTATPTAGAAAPAQGAEAGRRTRRCRRPRDRATLVGRPSRLPAGATCWHHRKDCARRSRQTTLSGQGTFAQCKVSGSVSSMRSESPGLQWRGTTGATCRQVMTTPPHWLRGGGRKSPSGCRPCAALAWSQSLWIGRRGGLSASGETGGCSSSGLRRPDGGRSSPHQCGGTPAASRTMQRTWS
mmetsp:Transcript_114028/g.356556  ORF Transcript_114028/g.356556 Transcript_114028/m.356556 type:complete len:280 (+) Transcript_114028:44-883(+)